MTNFTNHRVHETKNNRIRIGVVTIFLSVVAISYFRSPEVVGQGRFWAEEGTLWWANSQRSGLLETLFYIPDLAGYFSLNANLSFVVASIFPIELQPLIVTWIAVVTMASPAVIFLLISHKHPITFRISVTVFLTVGAPLLEPEVFSNVINSQVFFGLSAVIVLAFDTPSRSSNKWILAFLLVAGMSGMYASILAPLFILKALLLNHDPRSNPTSKESASSSWLAHRFSGRLWKQAVVISLCLVSQLLIFGQQRRSGNIHSTRASRFPSISDLTTFVESNLRSLLGDRNGATSVLVESDSISTVARLATSCVIALMIVEVGSLFRESLRTRQVRKGSGLTDEVLVDHRPLAYLLLAFFVESIFVLVGYVDMYPHSRYQVVPASIIGVALLFIFSSLRPGRGFSWVLVSVVFILSTSTALPDDERNFISCEESVCVPWVSQVQGVKEGTLTQYQFWPYSGPWTIDAK